MGKILIIDDEKQMLALLEGTEKGILLRFNPNL
jgi:hypothetical protein